MIIEQPTKAKVDFGDIAQGTFNLNKPTQEIYDAIIDKGTVDNAPRTYKSLKDRIESCQEKFPPVYRQNFINPFIEFLDKTGEFTVNVYLYTYGEDCVLCRIAQPLIQRCSGFEQAATDAFQEIVSDLYDGFLSAEDREGIKPPDFCVIAPLISWLPSWTKSNGSLEPTGPCTNPASWLYENFGIGTGIVNLPVQFAEKGLLAWGTLGHECAGHDILSADKGLLEEMQISVGNALTNEKIDQLLVNHWCECLEEAASDVMGILNMGPAVGLALIGYFRALNNRMGGESKLDNCGYAGGVHPADILRAYLAAYVIRNLEFSKKDSWADAIEAEADRDLSAITLNVAGAGTGNQVDSNQAKRSARIVAQTIVGGKMNSLEKHSLGEIQNWHDHDEDKVNELRLSLKTLSPISNVFTEGIYAAHVAAAAIVESMQDDANIGLIFNNMLSILKAMHDENPVWKLAIYLEHPGDISLEKIMLAPISTYCRRC